MTKKKSGNSYKFRAYPSSGLQRYLSFLSFIQNKTFNICMEAMKEAEKQKRITPYTGDSFFLYYLNVFCGVPPSKSVETCLYRFVPKKIEEENKTHKKEEKKTIELKGLSEYINASITKRFSPARKNLFDDLKKYNSGKIKHEEVRRPHFQSNKNGIKIITSGSNDNSKFFWIDKKGDLRVNNERNLKIVDPRVIKKTDDGIIIYSSIKQTKQKYFLPYTKKILKKDTAWIVLPSFKEGLPINYHRPLPRPEKIDAVSITKTNGIWHASFNTKEVKKNIKQSKLNVVGTDRGVNSVFAISSSNGMEKLILTKNGEKDEKFQKIFKNLKHHEKEHKKYQSKLNRLRRLNGNKTKTCQYRKFLASKQKHQRKINDIKTDFKHKFSKLMVEKNAVIIIEKLSIKNMTKSAKGTIESPGKNIKAKSGLNREMLKWGHFEIISFIKYKAKEKGCQIIEIDPKYTSQTCFVCEQKNKENRDDKNKKKFECVSCRHKADADLNASLNIMKKGCSKIKNDLLKTKTETFLKSRRFELGRKTSKVSSKNLVVEGNLS